MTSDSFADFQRQFDHGQLGYGPWSPAVTEPERGKQLRCLGGLVAAMLGSHHPSIPKLRLAENGQPDALRAAHSAIEGLPALTRRRLLSAFQAVSWPDNGGDR